MFEITLPFQIDPYIKIGFWIIFWALFVWLAFYLREWLPKSVHRNPPNEVIHMGLFISALSCSILIYFCQIYSSNKFADILTSMAIVINLFVAYSAFQFIDKFDLKKGYKTVQHQVVLDFVVELCALNLTVMSNLKGTTVLDNQPFGLISLESMKKGAILNHYWDKKVYLHKSIIEKLIKLRKLASHPYFHETGLSKNLSSIKFNQPSKIMNKAVFLYDVDLYVCDLADQSKFMFEININEDQPFIFKNAVEFFYEIGEIIENYYVKHFPEYTPLQFRESGHIYMT